MRLNLKRRPRRVSSLVVLLWLMAIAAVAVVGWLVGSDIVKGYLQPSVTARHADLQ